jgi:hypothetical protein
MRLVYSTAATTPHDKRHFSYHQGGTLATQRGNLRDPHRRGGVPDRIRSRRRRVQRCPLPAGRWQSCGCSRSTSSGQPARRHRHMQPPTPIEAGTAASRTASPICRRVPPGRGRVPGAATRGRQASLTRLLCAAGRIGVASRSSFGDLARAINKCLTTLKHSLHLQSQPASRASPGTAAGGLSPWWSPHPVRSRWHIR